MKTALVQTDLIWENPQANLRVFEKLLETLEPDTDLIILPEMFTSGFTMNPEKVAQTMSGNAVKWLQQKALEKQTAITGSVVITENGSYYNRLIFAFPDGSLAHYDKRHLFTLAGEDKKYTAGKEKLIVEYKGWKICLLVCYEVRFPVFSRNAEDYDLLIYVANFPEKRIPAWDILLPARAVENMSYTIGVNRTGEDENQNTYNGHSQVLDCLGNYLLPSQTEKGIFYAVLDKNIQNELRKKLGFLNDRDSFSV
ncbi:MAG: nitrilase family protein [Flavobacteriaceae bacterium]